ncbi:MAG TPA: hypothetical protein EYG85_06185 [Crocinitomix sp.]|nr:hypothetical protein [Crocinitomix sp.]
MNRLKNILLVVTFILISVGGYAQNYTAKAYKFYQVKQFDSAMLYIDSAVVSIDESKYSKTWQLRGVVYRNLEAKHGIKYREIALQSFLEARKVDTLNEFKLEIDSYIENLNVRYYNDAVNNVLSGNLEKAEQPYLTYKQNYWAYLDENKDFNAIDIQFYNALASAWFKRNTLVESGEKKTVYSNAIRYFGKVLAIDSTNYSANYGIGISYYNQGADVVEGMDPFSTDIEEIDRIQNESIELFKSGEPYLKKAFEINPNEKEVVEGLTGIYYSLNEDKEYEYFQQLLNKMEE